MPLIVHITPIQASYADSLYDSPMRMYYAYMTLILHMADMSGWTARETFILILKGIF